MPAPKPNTTIVIVRLKEGVNLDNANPSNPAFTKLTTILKKQPGYLGQYWGHQVEHPELFVWCIDWESFDSHTNFVPTPDHATFISGFPEVFDMAAMPPLIVDAHLTSAEDAGPAAAFEAPVTELGFFRLPNGTSEDVKAALEEAAAPINKNVITAGKAKGAASGWGMRFSPSNSYWLRKRAKSDNTRVVHTSARPGPDVPAPGKEWLAGAYGYDSIEAHMKWREQPEHAQAEEIFGDLEKQGISCVPADAPGIDPERGYFHVKFHRG